MYSKYKQEMLGQNILSKYFILIIYSIRFEMKAVTVAQDLPYPGVSTQ